MSARMVQRALRASRGAPLSVVQAGGVEEEEEEEEEQQQQQAVSNPFDLLGLQDEDEVDEVELHEDTSSETAAAGRNFSESSAAKSKKKKKGKKKRKALHKAAAHLEQLTSVSQKEAVFEEFEKRLKLSEGGPGVSEVRSSSGRKGRQVLAVETKFLRGEDELRRIFGSKVINAVKRSEDGGGSNWSRRQVSKRGVRALRKTVLIVPLETWPRWNGSLSMELVNVRDGLQFFRYKPSASYVETQRKYEACVHSYDPNSIAMLLVEHPYHVDSLLCLAELHRHMGAHQEAAELLEQGLYALEYAWHPMFDPTLGTCRLDFSHEPNRPLFHALFKHMQHLGRRGCHRTALEVCKLLLSLDSDDPMGALFCIDYFALRAEQYEWLECFAEGYDTDRPLSLFPNFSFSLAIARFRIEDKEQASDSLSQKHRAATVGKATSLELLKRALMLHPSMLRNIVDKAPIKEDAGWAEITRHAFFNTSTSVGDPSLEHLISIYLTRNHLLWRASDIQLWLKTAASAVMQHVDKKDEEQAANWACVREQTFHSTENEYGHLLVSDFSDNVTPLPPEEMEQLMFHAGPQAFLGGFPGNDLGAEAEHANNAAIVEAEDDFIAYLQIPWTQIPLAYNPFEEMTDGSEEEYQVL